MAERGVAFSKTEMRRLSEVCRALGTSYVEFVHFAVMQSVAECEGYASDEQRQAHAFLSAAAHLARTPDRRVAQSPPR